MNENDSEQDGKDKRPSRGISSDAKSRNWRFLFDNLKRAVGYIYSMCEQDGDIEECKEAIMVLHNRIKEFEGLIQYIEVQASYETSDERPSSVAWEVPVSAIKQPSLPFQPNGDPQLYYYQCLPQAYPQYSMPGTYPMMDPNLVNYMPYNQQYTGYPADYMAPGGTPQQPTHQYQQYNNYTDFSNISSSGSKTSKKNYSKSRRSGSKHDHYKSHNQDVQINHSVVPQMQNLNALEVPVDVPDIKNEIITHEKPQIIDYSSSFCINPRENSTTGDSDLAINNEKHEISIDNVQNGLADDSAKVDLKETLDIAKTNNLLPSIIDNCHSVAINEEIADAIDDRSSVDDDSTSMNMNSKEAEWTVVNTDSENYVHVSENLSEHSLPTSPNSKESESLHLNENKSNSQSDDINYKNRDCTVDINSPDEIPIDNSFKIVDHCEIKMETTDENPRDVPVDDLKDVKIIEDDEIKPDAFASSNDDKVADAIMDSSSECPINIDNRTCNINSDDVQLNEIDITICDENAVDQLNKSTSDSPCKKVPVTLHSAVMVQENHPNLETSNSSSPQTSDIANNHTRKKNDKESESYPDSQTASALQPDSKQSNDQTVNIPTKALKLSCSSEMTDPDTKEVDLLSESGLSTVSSGSVQSCMSLPSNPLARSTSWAELVRKGKTDSPVPGAPGKIATSTKYQSTPSRYLSHRQPNAKNVKPVTQLALTKSKSVPSQRMLTKTPLTRKTTPKVKEPLITEDGWCVSSGKSRFKTIAGGPTKTSIKPGDEETSPDNSKCSAKITSISKLSNNDIFSKSKISDTVLKSKTSENADKPKTPRGVKSKTTPTISGKPMSGKFNSRASTIGIVPKTNTKAHSTPKNQTANDTGSKINTGIKSHCSLRNNLVPKSTRTVSAKVDSGISKNIAPKPLTKTKSLESPTKLSDKLKVNNSQMTKKAKSLDPLEKTECTDEPITEGSESTSSELISPKTDDLNKEFKEITSEIIQEYTEPLIDHDLNEKSDQVCCSIDGSDASSVEAIKGAIVKNSDDSKASDYKDQVEVSNAKDQASVPTSLVLIRHEEEDTFNVGRVMMSKRNRQQSEQSSVSTDTLEEDSDVRCLSPGRSPGRSPSSRSSGGGGRSPGKAPQLHQRLSSPSRRRNTTDTVLKNHQERLAKAQVMRDKIQEEKANKIKKIKIKEEQVKDLQEQQEKERVARAITHAEKLARAETLRDKKIAEVKRKAQEEDQKVNEIAFINSLEAQNRKMELLSKEQVAEAKRVEIQVRQQEERKRKSEELQAKEDAVLERKLAIEADRLARIAHIEDKIKESQAKVDSNKLEMETAAKEAAKDRAFERELTRELVRHDRNPVVETKTKHKGRQQQQANNKLREMQQKAAMLCQQFPSEYLPTDTLYEPAKWCSKCNIKIVSEAVLMAHMIKRHQKSCPDEAEVESQYIVDYSDEHCPIAQDVVNRQKLLRKRSKKVRTRVITKLSELPAAKLLEPLQECPNKNRLFKCIKAMKNEKTKEKGLGDLSRTVLTRIDVNHLIDKGVLDQLCEMIPGQQLLGSISKVLLQCSTFSPTACQVCVRSLPHIIDCLQPGTGLLSPAMHADLLKLTATLTRSLVPCDSLASDVVSYITSKEIIDNIQTRCTNIYQLDDECAVLINCLDLLSACCVAMTTPGTPISISPTKNDPSQLIDTLVITKACNIVSLLYGVLLYQGHRRVAPSLTPPTKSVVTQCLTTLLDIARFSLHTLQLVLDSEGMSLELRHVISYVLSSAAHHGYTHILDLCIQLIGFVVFCDPSNQKMLQNGPSPSILQLLASLPFSYFSDMRGMSLLFPTLVSACHNCPSNLAILQEKVNKVMLISYLKDQLKESKEKHINLYPRTVFQQALKFLETPDTEVT